MPRQAPVGLPDSVAAAAASISGLWLVLAPGESLAQLLQPRAGESKAGIGRDVEWFDHREIRPADIAPTNRFPICWEPPMP